MTLDDIRNHRDYLLKVNGKKYRKQEGTRFIWNRVTDCCGAYAKIHQDDCSLICRKCFETVSQGEGDGLEWINLNPARSPIDCNGNTGFAANQAAIERREEMS